MLFFGQSAFGAGLRVVAAQTSSEQGQLLAGSLAEQGVLEEFSRSLNQRLQLDQSVSLGFAECGEANAWYLPGSREVTVCIELVDYYYRLLGERYAAGTELDQAVGSAFSFIVLHEVGHALVDVLDLPVTGREEDAVDQLAVWLLLQEGGGDGAVVEAAFSFLASQPWGEQSEAQLMGDEHALDSQRFFNLLCWVYGSAPEQHDELARRAELPERRMRQCEREYQRLDRSWRRLLAASLRERR